MEIQNLPTLTIHKLTKEQYEREFQAGNIDEYALYITPEEDGGSSSGIDRATVQSMIDEKFDSIINGNEVAY